jgi:hypothetical protein
MSVSPHHREVELAGPRGFGLGKGERFIKLSHHLRLLVVQASRSERFWS